MAAASRVLILSEPHGAVDPRNLELTVDCETAIHACDIGSALNPGATGRNRRPGGPGALAAEAGPSRWMSPGTVVW